MKKKFEIVSVNVSTEKGTVKRSVESIELDPACGIRGDAHAGDWHRQVSLLAIEDIDTMKEKLPTISPGDFAENITTRGIELAALPVGMILNIGETELEVTQIGKECHSGCEIMKKTGECVMPRRGVFARVLKGGTVDRESIGSYNIG